MSIGKNKKHYIPLKINNTSPTIYPLFYILLNGNEFGNKNARSGIIPTWHPLFNVSRN
jgi:hypothetical protein